MKILLQTLKAHRHISGDIERGIRTYNRGGIVFTERGESADKNYVAQVPAKNRKSGSTYTVQFQLTNDGTDIVNYSCSCVRRYKTRPICHHIVGAVLELQGGEVQSALVLGQIGYATRLVNNLNTAKTVGSGSLPVFATPSMIALMEMAACNCIDKNLDLSKTSVGTKISVEHLTPSPIGMEIVANAKLEQIKSNELTFSLEAFANDVRIGVGTHTRFIVDTERFMKKVESINPYG